ncbi:MAG: hypothetical protein AAFQ10_00090 [Pseudomonadota bacterium]
MTQLTKQRRAASKKSRRSKRPPKDGAPFRTAASHMRYSIQEQIPELVNTACYVPDADEGAAHLNGLTEAAFMAKYGAAKTEMTVRAERAEQELSVATSDLEAARLTDRNTPEWVESGKANHDRSDAPKVEVPISDWQMRHKTEALIICVLLIVALTASFITAYGNLMGTGLPVFLETPLLAGVMAMMAPMAGISVKLFNSNFRTDKGHRKFTVALNSVAIAFVLVWVVLFSEQFHGLSTSVVAGGLFDDPTLWDEVKDTLFVAITLLCEISIGAVLANRLDRIATKYAPESWSRNPESATVQEHVRKLEKVVEERSEHFADISGQLSEFDNALKLDQGLAQLAYAAKRARNGGDDLL